MPDDKDAGKSDKTTKSKTLVEVKVERKSSNDAAYQELVKTCKDSDNDDDDEDDDEDVDVDRKITMETNDEIELAETSTGNGEQYDEHYDSLGDSYFQNEAITLKVINDQIGKKYL